MTKYRVLSLQILMIIFLSSSYNFCSGAGKNRHVLVMYDISGSVVDGSAITDATVRKWKEILECAIFENFSSVQSYGLGIVLGNAQPNEFLPLLSKGTRVSIYYVGNSCRLIADELVFDGVSRQEILKFIPAYKSSFKENFTDIEGAELTYLQKVESSDDDIYWVLFSDEQHTLNPQGSKSSELLKYRSDYHVEELFFADVHTNPVKPNIKVRISVWRVKFDPVPDANSIKLSNIKKNSVICYERSTEESENYESRDKDIPVLSTVSGVATDNISELSLRMKIFDEKGVPVNEVKLKNLTLPFHFSQINTSQFFKKFDTATCLNKTFKVFLSVRYKFGGKIRHQDLTEANNLMTVRFENPSGAKTQESSKDNWYWYIFGLSVIAFILYLLYKFLHPLLQSPETFTLLRVDGATSKSYTYSLKPGKMIQFGKNTPIPNPEIILCNLNAPRYAIRYEGNNTFNLLAGDSVEKTVNPPCRIEFSDSLNNIVVLQLSQGHGNKTTNNKLFHK